MSVNTTPAHLAFFVHFAAESRRIRSISPGVRPILRRCHRLPTPPATVRPRQSPASRPRQYTRLRRPLPIRSNRNFGHASRVHDPGASSFVYMRRSGAVRRCCATVLWDGAKSCKRVNGSIAYNVLISLSSLLIHGLTGDYTRNSTPEWKLLPRDRPIFNGNETNRLFWSRKLFPCCFAVSRTVVRPLCFDIQTIVTVGSMRRPAHTKVVWYIKSWIQFNSIQFIHLKDAIYASSKSALHRMKIISKNFNSNLEISESVYIIFPIIF